MGYDFFGQNDRRATYLGPENVPALKQGRDQMAEAGGWLGQPGAQGADAVTASQMAQAGREAALRRADGPMAAQASARDVAAAYGGAARGGGMHAAQEYGQRLDNAIGNQQSLYEGDVAQYRTMAEAYNDKMRINREIEQANKARKQGAIKQLFASVPIIDGIL